MFRKILASGLLTATIFGCSNSSPKSKVGENPGLEKQKTASEISGNYVSVSYHQRNDGYDWVAVSVNKLSDSTIHVAVRSRADKKKPTCTFDADALKLTATVFQSYVEGKTVLFTFNDHTVSISSAIKEDEGILNFYCSGGGSLADTYTKVHEPLDEKQIDPTIFNKVLSLQNINFYISAAGKGSIQQLIIQPYGLKERNDTISVEIDGKVVNAEIEDLNSDGFPEVLIYTVSAGSGSYGNVIGYSVNTGKSISQIYFPPITENPEAGKGYRGHDEFAIVETALIQRFKIYNEKDANANPTGKMRQIQYKLGNGEASRKFVIDKIVEN